MSDSFEERWRNRLGLSLDKWRVEAKAHLKSLPFSTFAETWPLVRELFTSVPNLLKSRDDTETALLAEAFGWCCFSFWQCVSNFPAFPENYGLFLRDQLFRTRRNSDAVILARQLVELNAGGGNCGFNKLLLADAQKIRDGERLIAEGKYDAYLAAMAKYEEYATYLRNNPEFWVEWRAIKGAFPAEIRKSAIVHRTLIPERNWVRGPGAEFKTRRQKFQAVFDLFCWKYFLWGMKGDEPLLMKASVVFTPLGTQIFIPGYLSLDAKRDLDFKMISELHRARGLPRQGAGLSIGRLSRLELASKANAADRVARAKGLKGDARYDFVAKSIGMADLCDYRGIRKLLQRRK